MATDDYAAGLAGSGNRIISGNNNSGYIAGGDMSFGAAPPPPVAAPAKPAESAAAAVSVLRILFLGASPSDVPGLRLDHEIREVDLALRQAEFRDRFELKQQLAVRSTDLQAALLRHRPHIVHFGGHGETDGIFLEDENGQSMKVEASVLARILGAFKKQIRCVVLNACYSQEQAEAIAKDIDCVVGMSCAISDRSSIRFSAAFYQALASGSSVEMAFDLGCAQIDLTGLREGQTPQLVAFRKDPGEMVFVEA